jgi:hypothetical protein
MNDRQFGAVFLLLLTLASALSFSLAFPQLASSIMLSNRGTISAYVTAKSGSAKDIQAAIDIAAASIKGVGTVCIPAGTYNFVNIGEPWKTVNVPAGVNLFGAPTQRYPNGSVVSWSTILVMPWDVPGNVNGTPPAPSWFTIDGNGNSARSSRFSDICLEGYRYFNSSSTTGHYAVMVSQVMDFRIDHCYFRDTTFGLSIQGGAQATVRGVIDHNELVNTNGNPGMNFSEGGDPYLHLTVGYAVGVQDLLTSNWENDVSNVFGHYTNYTIFIEDNYFQKWRHCVSSNDGAHYVFRYNTIEGDFSYGAVDAHGKYNVVGTRASEIYNNSFINPIDPAGSWAIQIRGGATLVYNNTCVNYENFVRSWCEVVQPDKTNPHDCYYWSNTLTHMSGTSYLMDAGSNGGLFNEVDYFYHAPNATQFAYTPYVYPHPLTMVAGP